MLGVHARLHEPVEHVLLLDVAHERPFDVFDRHEHCLLGTGEGRVGSGIGGFDLCPNLTAPKDRPLEESAQKTGAARQAEEIRWGGTLEPDDTADKEAWIEIRGRNTDIESSRG